MGDSTDDQAKRSLFARLILLIPQDASGDLALTPCISKCCNWCSLICVVMAAWVHMFYEYADVRPAISVAEDPWVVWLMQMTATLALGGLLSELGAAAAIKFLGVQTYNAEDLTLQRRLRLRAKMIYVFTFLTIIYHLMAFDYQYVHEGWIAEYHGGHQIVYSFRYIEWVNCAPFVLSMSGQLPHAKDGTPRNGLIPSSMLTGIYCIISWQGLVVKDFWAAWVLIGFAFVSYFFASAEQLAFIWYLKDQGRQGMIRASFLIYLVIMIGIYGVVFLLPIPGWLSAAAENKFYCLGDISFKLGTCYMLSASNDLKTVQELKTRADLLEDDVTRLINNASVPILGVDSKGIIQQWNQKIADMTGVTQASALNISIFSLVSESRKKELKSMIALASIGDDPGTMEISIDPRQCEELCAERPELLKKAKLALSFSPRTNNLGDRIGVTFIGCDLTEVSAYQEAEARKTRFLGVVSHELRSPLHGIIGLIDILSHSESDDMKQKQMTMISNCAKRLLALVVNIMEMASLGSQSKLSSVKKLSKDPMELNKILEEVILLVESSVDKRCKPLVAKAVQLVNEVKELPIFEADAHKCTQVFYNLITNACKFTKKGSVTISSKVDSAKTWVEISIGDTGCGIGKDALERIFEPFEQEDGSEARTHEGIGLGLSIAKEVVELHGGRITVESDLGVGSTFTVHLPMNMAAAKEASESPEVPEPQTEAFAPPTVMKTYSMEVPVDTGKQAKKLLLSVDDDLTNQLLIQSLLGEDYRIDTAMDGFEAFEYLQECRVYPDIVLLDVMMPGMTGIEVCQKVRQELKQSPSELPILMISATSVEGTVVDAFEAGCNDYLSKPLGKRELKARIKAALDMRR
eukprot:TRINITY_DN2335_c0_g1_i1.p1 TRINITY_DN2335_c0_g1~~TRINITY_DN2335_c0_g1_i1.p1  ORF type:complete len:888 (+),score=223.89 TRINITY_DN2335_c0_g1_i1:76-2664(+)